MSDRNMENETVETGPGAALDRVIGVEGGIHPEPAEEWAAHATTAEAAGQPEEVHAHSEHSIWPFVVAIGLLLLGGGFLLNTAVAALGGVIVMVAVVRWMWEPWTS